PHVGGPDQGRPIIAQDVVDLSAIFAPRHRKSLYPRRRMDWRIFLVEMFACDAVRKPLQGQWTGAQMRQYEVCDVRIVRDDLSFRETAIGEVNLFGVRDGQLAAFDVDQFLCLHDSELLAAGAGESIWMSLR